MEAVEAGSDRGSTKRELGKRLKDADLLSYSSRIRVPQRINILGKFSKRPLAEQAGATLPGWYSICMLEDLGARAGVATGSDFWNPEVIIMSRFA